MAETLRAEQNRTLAILWQSSPFRLLLSAVLAALLWGAMYGYLRTPVQQDALTHHSGENLPVGGRYQFVVQGNQEFIFDTQTGRLWSRVGSGATNSWEMEASLPSSPSVTKP